ncbi:hypothetical protein SASPL_141645 [Salvia splendens]|uniref:Uncharacterized protein n=1 Tax=Salvia splendens TaxID=180675 RepID=A0A8X8ZD03_SALSN|nr:hypothetical protein SASPL_141645 [Salvia splendens]
MGEEISNKQVILSNYVKTSVNESDMSLRTSKIQLKIPSGCDGAVLVKNLYLSIDPFILALMKNQELDLPSFMLDSPIYGFGVSKVLDSSHPNFKTGELVWGVYWLGGCYLSDLELVVCESAEVIFALPKRGKLYMSLLHPELLVSSLVSLQRSQGVTLLGVQGAKKSLCFTFDEQVGFDEAFNYKEEQDYNAALKRYFPDGIDIYFDNMGGKMLEAVLNNMRLNGRVALCGMISQYNNLEQPEGVHNLINAIYGRYKRPLPSLLQVPGDGCASNQGREDHIRLRHSRRH